MSKLIIFLSPYWLWKPTEYKDSYTFEEFFSDNFDEISDKCL